MNLVENSHVDQIPSSLFDSSFAELSNIPKPFPDTVDPIIHDSVDPIEPVPTDPIEHVPTDPIEHVPTDPIEPVPTDPIEPPFCCT